MARSPCLRGRSADYDAPNSTCPDVAAARPLHGRRYSDAVTAARPARPEAALVLRFRSAVVRVPGGTRGGSGRHGAGSGSGGPRASGGLTALPAVEQDEDDATDDGGEDDRCGHCGHGLIRRSGRRQEPGRGRRRRAARAPAGRRRGRVHDARGSLRSADAADRAHARAHPGGRRGGRAGGVAGRAAGPGPLRGPVLAEDLDPADRRQPRAHARRAGGAQRAAVLARRRRGRGRAVGRSRPLPAADHPTYPGGWAIPPRSWARLPEERLLAAETLQQVRAAIAKLPRASRRSSCCATSRAGSPRRSPPRSS